MHTEAEGTPRSDPSTFDRWKDTYERLISNLDSFLEESAALELMVQQPDAQKWSGLKEAVHYIGSAHDSLETRCSKLNDVRASLGAIRNDSRTLVPLNNLPTETIVHILSLANTDCIIGPQGRIPNTPLLRRVYNTSRYLRNVVIRAPSLWTHVDLIVEDPGTYLEHGRLCVQYSDPLPLHVHIYNDDDIIDPRYSTNLAHLLRPCIHRIVSLNFGCSAPFAADLLLKLWQNVPTSQVQEFYFSDHSPDNNPPYYNNFFSVLGAGSDAFVQNFQRLKLYGAFAPLNSSAYRGLTVLKLIPWDSPEVSTPIQLTSALAACPNLRSLALISFTFQHNSTQVKPIVLPKLEVLDIRLIFDNDLLMLLSCITPGSNELALSVVLSQDHNMSIAHTLWRYIKKSKVTRLLVDAMGEQGTLDWIVEPTPGNELAVVQELALLDFAIIDIPPGFLPTIRPFSGLHTLHLMQCNVVPDTLHQLFGGSSIQTLRTEHCHTTHSEGQSISQLSDFVPSVKQQEYSILGHGEGDLEWPLYTP